MKSIISYHELSQDNIFAYLVKSCFMRQDLMISIYTSLRVIGLHTVKTLLIK